MPSKPAKQIVVDASVARASGGELATHPTSTLCRDFLLTMKQKTAHRLVMTTDIAHEWDRHQSGFARKWRASMVASRRIHPADHLLGDHEIIEKLDLCLRRETEQRAVAKDHCLIQAALATHKSITSLDNTMRELLAIASQNVGELRDIVWINPSISVEEACTWLVEGAKADNHRKLGARLF